MADARLLDLLDQWETEHDAGREVTGEELAPDNPALADQLDSWIRRMRATDWLRRPPVDEDEANASTVRPATDRTREIPRTEAGGGRQRFLDCLAASGLLDESQREGIWDDERLAAASDRQLAQWLVEDGQLSRYQADCLLRGDPGRLVLGKYVIQDLLGSGGMGDVYLAWQRGLERHVALKVLPAAASRRPDLVARFQREVQSLARLSHAHIVTAHDADEDRGTHFLVMEHVAGEDLQALVARRGPLPWREAAEYVRQAALGLAYAHGRGLIHRDVKPSNLMVASAECAARNAEWREPESHHSALRAPNSAMVKVLDLGLAGVMNDFAGSFDSLTRTGAILGTIDFLAPEQSFDLAHVDHRADIYSLGCTLYYLLAGRPAFSGRTLAEKLLAHRDEPVDLSGAGFQPAETEESGDRSQKSGTSDQEPPPVALLSLLAALLSKSPAARPQTMSAVAEALDCILRGASPTLPLPLGEGRGEGFRNSELGTRNAERQRVSSTPHSALRTPRTLSRRRLLTAGLATAAASAAGFGAFTIWKQLAFGSVRVELPAGGPAVAEILVDNKRIDPRHVRYASSHIELDLPTGRHEIRLLADACYPSIHVVQVPFGDGLQVTAAFAPAFRWRFTGDSERLGCIECAEDAWFGWALDSLKVNSAASVVRGIPIHWSLLKRSHPARTHYLLYDSKRTLACGENELHPFTRCKFEDTLEDNYCWRIYNLPDECFAAEYTASSRRGCYLTPNSAVPRIATTADGSDSFDANPVGVRAQAPPAETKPGVFLKRRVHIVVAGGQTFAGHYLSIDETALIVPKNQDQFAGAVRLTATPTTEWDVVPTANAHALRVSSGKFKYWWLDFSLDRRMEQHKNKYAANITQLAWGGRVMWTLSANPDNSFTLQVSDKYFSHWHLAVPPTGTPPADASGPGLSLLGQTTRWEFRTP